MWPERASIETLHRQSFPTRNLRCLGRRKCHCGLCLPWFDVMAFHRAKSGRSATGGAPFTQPSRPTTILTIALHGQKYCLWLIHALGPRSSYTQIHLGACLTAIFAGHWPPMSTTSNVNAIQREEDKRPERRAWSSIIVFHLAFDSPQRTCRTLNHPATTRTSNVKVGRPVSNSQRSYSLVVRMILTVLTYNIRSNNNQSTRNGGDALWNAMNAPVGNPRPRPINPTLVPQAVGPIQGVVPTTTTRAQPAQQPPQGERALILSIAVPLMQIQAKGDNLCRLLHHSHRW